MSTNSNKKQTRSRSPEKKAAQFERILETGKELFLDKGRDGFSLRGLAKLLGMNQNNLYNYVESKRELWIAIRNKFYKQFRDENIKIIKNHQGSTTDLLLKIFKHFLEFAAEDFGAFSMMHLYPSPPSDKIGLFEREYREFNFLEGTTRVIKRAIDAGEIKESNAAVLSFYIYSLILGAAIVERNMRIIEQNNDYHGDPASENIQFVHSGFSSNEFRNYVLDKLELFLKDSNLPQKESE